jgi:pyruvate dehydrogenase E1 component
MGILNDHDPVETQEWVDSLNAVVAHQGVERARFLLTQLRDEASKIGARPAFTLTTPYANTIRPEQEEKSPGNRELEHKIRSAIRWNAVAIILRANKESSELGGHIASFQSSALLYDIGFGHFWHAPTDQHGGDLIYVQGHVSPGIYARAFVEGRLTEQQILNYRQESDGKGIPSYPHPWLMPDFWQFPTVSMGLGPADGDLPGALPQVSRGTRTSRRPPTARYGRSWATANATSRNRSGAISMAGREKLDNLIFVINCNLQRLDGPVRGNGKIIQELEGVFRGAAGT